MSDNEYLHDLRVVNRYIEEGKLTDKEHKKFIKDLDDVTDKSEVLIIEEEIEEEEENTEEQELEENDEMGI